MIEPSLPVPSHLARWLGGCLCFYDQQLVAFKGDLEERMFLVSTTHYEAGVDGAETLRVIG